MERLRELYLGWKRIKYVMGSGVACSWESIWIFVSGIFQQGWKLYSVQSELSLRYNTMLGFVLGPPAHIQVYWQELLQERKLHARDAWSWMQGACATLLVGTWPSFQSCQLMESCSLVWPESGCVLQTQIMTNLILRLWVYLPCHLGPWRNNLTIFYWCWFHPLVLWSSCWGLVVI